MSSSSSLRARLTLVALLSATTFYFVYKSRRLNRILNLVSRTPKNPRNGKIFYISQTGISKALAQRLHSRLTALGLPLDLVDPRNYEPEDLPKENLVLIVASTWEDGKPPDAAKFFVDWLAESATDFRVGSLLLSHCKFAVFGVGSSAYGKTFNVVARDLSEKMRELGAAEVLPLVEGDVESGELDAVFENWSKKVVAFLKGDVGNGGVESVVGVESDDFDDGDDEEEEEIESDVVDLEDIAGKGPSRRMANVTVTNETNGKLSEGKKNMVTPVIRASLEKQVNLYPFFLDVHLKLNECIELIDCTYNFVFLYDQ